MMPLSNALLYLMGIPGSGKTTLLNAALSGVPATTILPAKPGLNPPHVVYPGGAQLGVPREKFGGTDALAMNIQPYVLDWLQSAPFSYVAAEGDRLTTPTFFASVVKIGWRLSVVYLNTPYEIAAERRAERGTRQNKSWIAGRITKIQNLIGWSDPGWRLDGALPLPELANRLRQHPIIRHIRGEV